ncbi:MAG TPA: hypothetical protein PKK15_25065, partial [Kouleothrix sp.]|nr:hypothetical protein [Kouleothrix sp.]
MAQSQQLLGGRDLAIGDTASPRQWSGWPLALARGVWVACAAIALLTVLFNLSSEFEQYLHTCASCDGPQLTPAAVRELEGSGLSLRFYAFYNITLELLFVITWCGVATIIFLRKSGEPLAWFVSLMLLTFGLAFPGFVDTAVATHPGWLWPLLTMPLLFVAIGSIIIFFYVFPNGRFVPRWTRWLCLAWVAWSIYWLAVDGLNLPTLYINSYYLALACGVVAQIYRYRSVANQVQRQQTKWVVFGITIAISIFILLASFEILGVPDWGHTAAIHFVSQATIYLSMSLIPLSIGMAILRARLWDIDALISRALVSAALTTCVIGLYVFLVGYLGALFQASGSLLVSLVATGLVAMVFQPLRERLQRGVNRLLYGDRDDPYAVVSRLSRRLEATLAPNAVLPTIVETVAQALKLPYVAIALDASPAPADQEAIVASYGRPTPDVIFLPLTYQGETLGQLLLAPRTPGEAFAPADTHLLADLARQAGVAAHAVQLTTALQRSHSPCTTCSLA